MKYDYCVLGAGISGLTIARLLSKNASVIVLEAKSVPGGIARPRDCQGVPSHLTGGHCFNSKHQEVLDFVFNEISSIDKFNLIERKAQIRLDDFTVGYPIELHVKDIYRNNPELAVDIVKDFFSNNELHDVSNLYEWFVSKFGKTLTDIYFEPYNKKIWGREVSTMSYSWVQDKLPQPNKDSFIRAMLEDATDDMPHAKFYYPKSNTQATFIDSMADGLNIIYNYKVNSLELCPEKNWVINEEIIASNLVSTIPLDVLLEIVCDCPPSVLEQGKLLKYNKITTMLWESIPTNATWTYIPTKDSIFHRYIHIGNFMRPVKNFTITESVGVRSREEMELQGKLDPCLIAPIDYFVSDHAYVVYDEKRDSALAVINKFLSSVGLFTLGRFAQWDYFNMDVCMHEAIKLSKILVDRIRSK